jgi:hypothetical protein
VYTPRVTAAECVAAASGSFVERVFGGALTPMFAHFIEQRRLTPRELDELRALLDAAPASVSRPEKNRAKMSAGCVTFLTLLARSSVAAAILVLLVAGCAAHVPEATQSALALRPLADRFRSARAVLAE